MSQSRRVIFVDIDQTIAGLPAKAKDYSQAEPWPQQISMINQLYQAGHRIVYWTARGSLTNLSWFKTTQSQLDSWGCMYHELRMGKPAFDLLIDDRTCLPEQLAQVLPQLLGTDKKESGPGSEAESGAISSSSIKI
jgi:hypothetical protein